MTKEQSAQLLNQAQLYQQQIQGMEAQKEALNLQMMEVSNALDELEKTSEKEVYKIAGPLIVKSGTSEVKKDMAEKKDLLKTRLDVLEKSEKKLKTKIDELREQLTKAGIGA